MNLGYDQITDSDPLIYEGFAVGRTSFWDARAGYRAQTLTRVEAVAQIAPRLREWVDVFEAGRLPHPAGTG